MHDDHDGNEDHDDQDDHDDHDDDQVEFIEDSWSKFHGGKNLLAAVCAREFRPVLNELDKTRLGNWKLPDSGDNWPKISPSCYQQTKARLHSPDVGRGEIIAHGLNLSKIIENPANCLSL